MILPPLSQQAVRAPGVNHDAQGSPLAAEDVNERKLCSSLPAVHRVLTKHCAPSSAWVFEKPFPPSRGLSFAALGTVFGSFAETTDCSLI